MRVLILILGLLRGAMTFWILLLLKILDHAAKMQSSSRLGRCVVFLDHLGQFIPAVPLVIKGVNGYMCWWVSCGGTDPIPGGLRGVLIKV